MRIEELHATVEAARDQRARLMVDALRRGFARLFREGPASRPRPRHGAPLARDRARTQFLRDLTRSAP